MTSRVFTRRLRRKWFNCERCHIRPLHWLTEFLAFFLPSRAGKSVLIFKNNKFWVNNQYRGKLNWACKDKDTWGCLCRVQTTIEGRFIRVRGGHNHEPNFTPDNFDAPALADKNYNDQHFSLKAEHSSKFNFYDKAMQRVKSVMTPKKSEVF